MLGVIIMPILSLFGMRYLPNSQQSSTTNIINALFGWSRMPWLGASLVFGSTAFAILGLLLATKWHHVTHDGITLAYLFVAASWTYTAPAFLWWYEVVIISRFKAQATEAIANPIEVIEFHSRASTAVLDSTRNRLFMGIWIAAVVCVLASSMDFANGLGIASRRDWGWWLLLVVAVELSYYVAYAFGVIVRTVSLIRFFASRCLKLNPYHEDGSGGVNFVIALSVTVSLMFSCVFIVPLLVKLGLHSFSPRDFAVIIMLYVAFILLPFVYSVYAMHSRIVCEKARMVASARSWLARYLASASPIQFSPESREFASWSALYHDIVQINDWPFNLKSGFSVIAVPVLLLLIRLQFEGALHAGFGH